MLMTPEIHAVILGFCLGACNDVFTNRFFAVTSLQAARNVIISCIQAAHEKYQSNPPDWQDVIVRGWCLLMKRDMRKFTNMCKDGLLGPGDYGIFEDWSSINKLQKKFICIKDRLASDGEVHKGPYEEGVCGFFLGIPPGSCLSLLALILPGRP
jgi:hypothetical protein